MAETSSRSGKGLRIWSVLLGLVLLATGLFFAVGGENSRRWAAVGIF